MRFPADCVALPAAEPALGGLRAPPPEITDHELAAGRRRALCLRNRAPQPHSALPTLRPLTVSGSSGCTLRSSVPLSDRNGYCVSAHTLRSFRANISISLFSTSLILASIEIASTIQKGSQSARLQAVRARFNSTVWRPVSGRRRSVKRESIKNAAGNDRCRLQDEPAASTAPIPAQPEIRLKTPL